MSDILAFESPELDAATYLRSLAAEADGVEMLLGPRGNRLRAIADLMDAIDEQARIASAAEAVRDLHAREYGGG